MRYIITIAQELEGHAGATAYVAPSKPIALAYIKQATAADEYQDEYECTNMTINADKSNDYYYQGNDGAMSINLSPYKENTELYARTG